LSHQAETSKRRKMAEVNDKAQFHRKRSQSQDDTGEDAGGRKDYTADICHFYLPRD
jgi:hypothetical protein